MSWLQRRWAYASRHPYWSAVLALLTFAAISWAITNTETIGNKIASAYASEPARGIGSALRAAWDWLWVSLAIPRIIVLVIIVVGVAVLSIRGAARLGAWLSWSEQVSPEAAPPQARAATPRAEEAPPDLKPRVNPPTAARLGSPPRAPFSELENTLLMLLASEYPDSVELRDLPARLKQTSLAAEQVADDLEGRGFVKVNRVVGYGSTSSGSVALTPAGRKLCIEKGLDLV